eukprot:m.8208 g.8208  ORF g.8208 m.8208 type:complete len:119 (+) comp5334_c0_seq1:796-1152(+)
MWEFKIESLACFCKVFPPPSTSLCVKQQFQQVLPGMFMTALNRHLRGTTFMAPTALFTTHLFLRSKIKVRGSTARARETLTDHLSIPTAPDSSPRPSYNKALASSVQITAQHHRHNAF